MESKSISLIPKPVKFILQTGEFRINSNTILLYQSQCKSHAQYFSKLCQTAMSFVLKQQESTNIPSNSINVIHLGLKLKSDPSSPAEGYSLNINSQTILLEGNDAAGCFYGIQTIRQIMPHEIESAVVQEKIDWVLPSCQIDDYPRFPWRGFMLDECRHFFGIVLAKRMIDLMALYKLNKLHWHLTEDEGWRIESKRFPNLHTIGSKRLLSKKWNESPNMENPQWYGGYYTQEEIKEIIAYAHDHYIEVIPEIEMPGHATAPLVAYPEYSCTTPPKVVPTVGAGNRQAYCAGYAPTYTFLHDVLDEIIELFGSTKIHIGGDELPKERWENCDRCQNYMKQHNIPNLDMLQVHFAADIINHLAKRNCKTFGWFDFPVDRLLDQKVDPNSVVFQFWVGSEKRVGEFVRKGGKAVISDNRFMYLDYTYNRINLKKAYTFDPIPADLEPQYHSQILGCEPPIWCERVPNWQRMDFQVFPRLCAYAETAWTPKALKNYPEFIGRLKPFLKRLDIKAVYYAPLNIATNSLKGHFIPRSKLYM